MSVTKVRHVCGYCWYTSRYYGPHMLLLEEAGVHSSSSSSRQCGVDPATLRQVNLAQGSTHIEYTVLSGERQG